MLTNAIKQNTQENRFIRLFLVFALMFAALHVALHDLDMSSNGLDEHEKCQVCRLNHTPTASLGFPSLYTPLQFLAHLVPVENIEYQLSHTPHAQRARAPPLF